MVDMGSAVDVRSVLKHSGQNRVQVSPLPGLFEIDVAGVEPGEFCFVGIGKLSR